MEQILISLIHEIFFWRIIIDIFVGFVDNVIINKTFNSFKASVI